MKAKIFWVKIDNPTMNFKYRLFVDSDEIINHKVNECNKLSEKEYKNRNHRVDKVIQLKLGQKLKFQ